MDGINTIIDYGTSFIVSFETNNDHYSKVMFTHLRGRDKQYLEIIMEYNDKKLGK